MKAVWTIAFEFARQQRVMWVIFAFWIGGFDLLIALTHKTDEASALPAIFTQQCVYGIVFAVFMAAAVVRNERNSRRVLAMLSKGISRAQYLAGHVCGIGILAVLYYVAAGVLFTLLSYSFGAQVDVVGTVFAGIVAALLATTVSLVFGSWLHPLIAAALTMAALAAPILLFGPTSDALVAAPVAYFIRACFNFDHSAGWQGPWSYWLIALLETAAAWLVATLIFERQDVAVPTE